MPVDFVQCHQCGSTVPVNQSIRARNQDSEAVCTTCAHSAGLPRVDTYEAMSQVAAVPWTPRFIDCIGVVQFDLQLGQVIEYLYPPMPFSTTQETEIAFLCFPDANHPGNGDSFHDFVYAYNRSECDESRLASKRLNVPARDEASRASSPGANRGSSAASPNPPPLSDDESGQASSVDGTTTATTTT